MEEQKYPFKKWFLIVALSVVFVQGSALASFFFFKKTRNDRPSEIQKVVQTGNSFCFLPTYYLAEILALSSDQKCPFHAFSPQQAEKSY